ncbi:MAG: hypoxanthine phosphoribosyltransferase [Desulfovibrionales bacterium]
MKKDELQVVFSAEQIQDRVKELGAEISAAYQGKQVVMVCVLKGAFLFFADLVRHIDIDAELDFVRLASYGSGKSRFGKVVFSKDMELPVEDKHIIIVEDIVDTGHSMNYLTEVLSKRGPRSITVCALIDKAERREVPVEVGYSGFPVKEGFLVGYGLDHAEQYRNLDGIYEIVP